MATFCNTPVLLAVVARVWYRREVQLPGRLSSSTLGDVLGALHRGRVSGNLELTECGSSAIVPGRRHRIHLARGLVTRVESASPAPLLGEILARHGLVDRLGLTAVTMLRAAGDQRLAGEILIAGGYTDLDRIEWALRNQTRERLDGLYRLRDAQLSFHPARFERSGHEGAALPLTPREFLEGRPRRRDPQRQSRPPRAAPRPSRRAGGSSPLDAARLAARAILEVEPEASPEDVRRAFRRIAGKLHPDRAPTEADRKRYAAEFARLSAAYHLLTR
jgi:hypothetical protein